MSPAVMERSSETRLTTLAAARAELDLASGADDDFLATLISQASDAVTSWCGRTFALETVRETIDLPVSSPAILPSRWPLVDIVSVHRGGEAITVADIETDDAGLIYRLDDAGDRLDWPRGSLLIAYRAGYVLPNSAGRTLPNDIERAALILVRAAFFARSRDPLIRSETVDGAGSIDFFAGTVSRLPPEVESILIPHRTMTFG